MATEHSLVETFGFTDERRQSLVSLIGLQAVDRQWATHLHDVVIVPHCDRIMAQFVECLHGHPEFARFLPRDSDDAHIREAQKAYLLSLGIAFDSAAYFESRLRIGMAHARAQIQLTLYGAAYAHLQKLIFRHIPRETTPQTYVSLTEFIVNISALDMALATEAYHLSRIGTLQQSLSDLRKEARELHRLVDTDTFTGLANHAHIVDVLARRLADADASPVSLIMIDLDRFKDINDSYGHLVGDDVIRSVARRLASVARSDDVVGRYGGDEFTVVLQKTAPAVVGEIAKRICKRIGSDTFEVGDLSLPITISIGVATAYPGENAESLTARADRALYRAKHAGRNRVVVADSAVDEPMSLAEMGCMPAPAEDVGR